MTYLTAYVATAIVFFGLDYVWLGTVAKDFYARQIGHLMADAPNFVAAGGFYLLYIAGVVFFAVLPASSWKMALVYGGLLGLLAYGTYDMTNLSTLKNWPIAMVVVDMAWGTVLTGLAALAGYLAMKAVA